MDESPNAFPCGKVQKSFIRESAAVGQTQVLKAQTVPTQKKTNVFFGNYCDKYRVGESGNWIGYLNHDIQSLPEYCFQRMVAYKCGRKVQVEQARTPLSDSLNHHILLKSRVDCKSLYVLFLEHAVIRKRNKFTNDILGLVFWSLEDPRVCERIKQCCK